MNTERIKKLLQSRAFRVVAVCIGAFLLLFAVWRVFFSGGKSEPADTYSPTSLEERLAQLLDEIEGVDGATVMIGEKDGEAVSAVVIIRGDLGLVTRMRVLDATANALHIARQDVLVYPADK